MLFAPVAWVIGIPWRDCAAIGNLLGTRMVLNELVAFSMLGPMKAALDPRSFTIATFALCGFANLSSIGIQIGGIGALAPNKKRRAGSAGDSRDAGGNDGQPDVGIDRGHAACRLLPVFKKRTSPVKQLRAASILYFVASFLLLCASLICAGCAAARDH